MKYELKIKIIVGTLLAITFLLPFFSAQNFSPASDEITHLPSGYSYWKTGFIDLNPQHPPFVKLIASFPLLFMDIKFDAKDPNLIGPLKDEWKFGANFLFSNDVDKLLLWGRMPVMLLSLLLGLYIFKWASEMFSSKAGLLALFLYAFMPNMIANAQFVTTDLAVTAFSFITLYYLWKLFSARGGSVPGGKFKSKKYLIYSGIFLGLALGSKFSAVLLWLIVILLIVAHFWPREGNFDPERSREGSPRTKQDVEHVRSFVRGSQRASASYGIDSKLDKSVKLLAALLVLSSIVVYFLYLMPTDPSFYLRGMKSVYADWGNTYSFYLNGEFSSAGWWYYFLFAFLIKTPIPFLIALGLGLIMYKKYKLSVSDRLFIFIPLVIFFAVTSLKAGNIGIRYLLPVYPFLILYAGGLADVFQIRWQTFKSKIIFGLAVGLAGWYVFSALYIYPDYITYFNEFVGGPKNGYKYLDDSNIEWGQDIKRLAAYQKQYPDTKVIYSWLYSNPSYYGVKNILPKEQESLLNPSGRYAVNIHFLVRLKELSQSLNEKGLDWLSLYQPIDRIGYSFFVYAQ